MSPTSDTLSQITDTGFTLSWTPHSDPGFDTDGTTLATITNYIVSLTDGTTSIVSNTTNTSVTFTGLNTNTTYNYSITGINSAAKRSPTLSGSTTTLKQLSSAILSYSNVEVIGVADRTSSPLWNGGAPQGVTYALDAAATNAGLSIDGTTGEVTVSNSATSGTYTVTATANGGATSAPSKSAYR